MSSPRFQIDEGFQQHAIQPLELLSLRVPARTEFRDPVLSSFEGVHLSHLIDRALERHYTAGSNVN